MAQVDTTDTRILKALCASSLLFMTALLSYSYFAKDESSPIKEGTVAKKTVIVDIAAKTSTSNSNSAKHQPQQLANTVRACLVNRQMISPDTVWLDFRFVDQGGKVPVGKHIKVFCPNPNKSFQPTWNGQPDAEFGKEYIERKYTPISSNNEGFILVVKSYVPNDRFKDGGKMSQYLANLHTNQEIHVALPFGIMEYVEPGQFRRSKQLVSVKYVGMLAGGSGITPMLRLLETSLADPSDTTKFALIFANRSECDILMKDHLDGLAKLHPHRFKVAYTLTRPAPGWKGGVGLITKEMIKEFMPPAAQDTLILCCGPPPMIKTCCKENLEILGYYEKQVWDF